MSRIMHFLSSGFFCFVSVRVLCVCVYVVYMCSTGLVPEIKYSDCDLITDTTTRDIKASPRRIASLEAPR